MSFMTELDVINDALSTLGEAPLNDADETHPLVPQIKRFIKEESVRVLKRSWWFNKEIVTLQPDALSSFIYVPADAISCDPLEKKNYEELLVMRGRRLYNVDKNTYVMDKEVDCYIIRDIPFEDLPVNAQQAVSIATSRRFQQAYDADRQRISQLEIDYREAIAMLRAEHIRNTNVNLIEKSTTLQSLNRIGGSIRRRKTY